MLKPRHLNQMLSNTTTSNTVKTQLSVTTSTAVPLNAHTVTDHLADRSTDHMSFGMWLLLLIAIVLIVGSAYKIIRTII
jgi:hypothetical protein